MNGMTTTPTGFTLRRMLFGDEHDDEVLRGALADSGVLDAAVTTQEGVSAGLLTAARDEVARVTAGLLDLDLVDVLVGGWRKYGALAEAARRSLNSPGAEEVVDLAVHRITSTHRPRIDLMVDGVKVAEVDFAIDLTIDLHAVRAVLVGGRLIALRSGRADLHAELTCEGVSVASATRQVELPVIVPLGSGVTLTEPTVILPPSPA
ncbi:MAG: hypothetical protein ACRDHS_08055 [Actinomycetota bacterium]